METEQIVNVENGKNVASFVTIRGSIPIFWTQIPCMKLKPPTKMATKEVFAPAFDRHITNLVSEYQVLLANWELYCHKGYTTTSGANA